MTFYLVRLFVCVSISSSSLHLVRFGELLRYADRRIVVIMKLYIERNNVLVELILFRKQILILFTFNFVCEAMVLMQYRSPNATLDSCCQTMSIVTSRWSHLSDIVHHSIEWCADVIHSTAVFTQLRRFALAFIHSQSGATGVFWLICRGVYFRFGAKKKWQMRVASSNFAGWKCRN